MQYCRKCGCKLEEGAKFCKSCGTPLQTGSVQPDPDLQQPQAGAKQPMSKKNMKLLIAVGIAIVVLFAGYKIGENSTSKDRLINNFEKALIAKDSSKVASLLSSNDNRLDINKASVQGFMNYLDENPEIQDQIVSNLNSESSYIDSTNQSSQNSYGSQNGQSSQDDLVNLESGGKFLFFNTYKLDVQPVFLTLQTNYKDTDLYVDGIKVGTSTKMNFEKTYGPFLPGIHKTEARLKTNLVNLTTKDSITLLSGTDSDDLSLNGYDLTVNLPNSGTNNGTAKLFINGNDVGVNLYKNPTYGPVLTNGSMKMYVETTLPWGDVKTDEVPIKSDEMDANFVNAALESTLMDTVTKNIDEWMQAYTTDDVSNFTTASDALKQTVKTDADNDESSGWVYDGTHLSTTFDLNSFNLDYQDGQWVATLTDSEEVNSAQFSAGDQPDLQDNNTTFDYQLHYDESSKKWLVDSKTDDYTDLTSDNVKTVTNPNPKQFVSSWVNAATN